MSIKKSVSLWRYFPVHILYALERKPLNTPIVQIKQISDIAPHIAMGVFKGCFSRAYKICTEKYLLSKKIFLIDIFTENGHNRNTLTNIATEYLQNINKRKSNDQSNTKNIKSIIKLPCGAILGRDL